MMHFRPAACLATLTLACAAQAQLVLNTTMTPEELVQNVLLGGNVQVSNIRFNGQAATTVTPQMASFNATSANLGMGLGVLMTSGGATNALGPNDSDASSELGGDFDANDPDLETLCGQDVHDAAVLEFDFIPEGDSLAFEYIFASEEYPEWVCSEFNDVFGFFLSGPGINGPFTNNAINIALIPNSSIPVAINTVNSGVPGLSGSGATVCAASDPNWVSNAQYYVANGDGFEPPYDSDPHYVQYDGFTVTLTARAEVSCGETYHIKLCLADAFDDQFDSGVFLKAGSFNSSPLPPLIASTVTGDGIVAEACEGSFFVVHRPAGVDTTLTIDFFFSGTATAGVDFANVPSPLVIPEGQDSILVDLHPDEDQLAEGQETVILTAYTFNTCGDSVFSSTTLIIEDYRLPEIQTVTPILLECELDSVLLTATASGGYGPITLNWNGEPAGGTLWVPGREDGDYRINAIDLCPHQTAATVHVESGCKVEIPNVISPNGDGLNDRFEIKGLLGKENSLTILNRWGQEVYSVNNYRNTFGASGLPGGTYFYVLHVEDEVYTGHLTVLSTK